MLSDFADCSGTGALAYLILTHYLTPNNFLFLKCIVSAYSAPEDVMNSQVKLNFGKIILT